MATTTFNAIVSSSTTAIGDYFGAYWIIIVPALVGIALAVAVVRRFRGGRVIRKF